MSAVFHSISLPNGRRLTRPHPGAMAVGGRVLVSETFDAFPNGTPGPTDRICAIEFELSTTGQATFKVLDPAPLGINRKVNVKSVIRAGGEVFSKGYSSPQLHCTTTKVDGANHLLVEWKQAEERPVSRRYRWAA